MKKLFLILTILLACLLRPASVKAIENPLSVPNNKIGIHILFPEEVEEAARLVNSNGAQWGYVTIPIQAKDKDREKWQAFMDNAKKNKVIPIVRIATENYYFDTKVWRKPDENDILDFANFLSSLSWPTKNKYVVVFNEVNRTDEWGGILEPEQYAQLLSYAVTVFKSKDQNFFMISAGLDNGAADSKTSFDEYTYMRRMNEGVPGIFNQIDGIASHSYPNPAFSQPPSTQTPHSITSFRYEKRFAESLSNKELPVFITETGWPRNTVSDTQIANYYNETFSTIWNDPSIVAITPFLLRAGNGPFVGFSFIDASGQKTTSYTTIEKLSKVKGEPKLSEEVLSATEVAPNLPVKEFHSDSKAVTEIEIPIGIKLFAHWLLKL